MKALPRFDPAVSAPTRYLFFTGKGGVGKTSLACATAVRFADDGKRVLLVSTDPASNLDQVLGVSLSGKPTPVPGAPGLDALNINPEEAAERYRERLIGPMRGVLPEAALANMQEQLSGSCTTEIAAFDEFTALIGQPEAALEYDHVIFDTAPTGHTLRLMSLSKAWGQFLESNTSGTSCLGPLAGLEKQREIYEATVRMLADGSRTTMVLVSRPQRAALREAARTSGELRALDIGNQVLVINGVFRATDRTDELALALERRGQRAFTQNVQLLGSLPVFANPLRPWNVLGIDGLRALLKDESPEVAPAVGFDQWQPPALKSLADLIEEIAESGHGVIMTMGKGGVGKTTLAASIAVALAERGFPVHLTTTDPAAHVADALGDTESKLTVGRIDPAAETQAYTRHVIETAGRDMDEASRALLEEDLRSPCTEEIAVFRAFAREVARGKKAFVVLDTAPTGHTLLLLDASEAYHRELGRQARTSQPEEVLQLLPRLRDRDFTHVFIVTLPEATPVHEAASLQADLRRAGIEPHGWIINQSLTGSGTTDPVLRQRESSERHYIEEVAATHASQTALVPLQREEPTGVTALSALAHSSISELSTIHQ
ncbi:MAG: arsenical pump-driving ATPase [Terrimicrobiaceae bacterium]